MQRGRRTAFDFENAPSGRIVPARGIGSRSPKSDSFPRRAPAGSLCGGLSCAADGADDQAQGTVDAPVCEEAWQAGLQRRGPSTGFLSDRKRVPIVSEGSAAQPFNAPVRCRGWLNTARSQHPTEQGASPAGSLKGGRGPCATQFTLLQRVDRQVAGSGACSNICCADESFGAGAAHIVLAEEIKQ